MSLTFYFHPFSPPSRAVRSLLLLTKTPHLEKLVDLLKGENKAPEYESINPNQSVPAISDGKFNLFESNAILRYICISRNLTSFYPQQDLQVKAKIDAFLDWHTTGMNAVTEFAMDFGLKPILFKSPVPQNKLERIVDVDQVLKFFIEVFLDQGKYSFIGDAKSITIADIRAIIDISCIFATNYDFEKFPPLKSYIQRVYKSPEFNQAQKEFFGYIPQAQQQLNPFIHAIVSAPIQATPTATLVLYFHPLSPPSRAVRSLCMMAKIDYTERHVDLQKGENRSAEFEKINPNQSVPAIQQGTYSLFESHAILKYIADQYRLQTYYPRDDAKQKALIDAYLDFSHTGMTPIGDFVSDFFFKPAILKLPEPTNRAERIKAVDETIDFFVNVFLEGGRHSFIMGNNSVSIADLSAISLISTLFAVNYDFSRNKSFANYTERILSFPQVKSANKEYFSFLNSMPIQFNQFIRGIVASNRKKGCC